VTAPTLCAMHNATHCAAPAEVAVRSAQTAPLFVARPLSRATRHDRLLCKDCARIQLLVAISSWTKSAS